MESSFPGTSVDIIPLASRHNIAAIKFVLPSVLSPSVDTRPAQAHNRGDLIEQERAKRRGLAA